MDQQYSILNGLEPDDELPEYLKSEIVSEIDAVRSSIVIVNHFTKNLIDSLTTCISLAHYG